MKAVAPKNLEDRALTQVSLVISQVDNHIDPVMRDVDRQMAKMITNPFGAIFNPPSRRRDPTVLDDMMRILFRNAASMFKPTPGLATSR